MIYLLSFLLTFILCVILVEKPIMKAIPTKRGLHVVDTPTSGGIALLFGFSIAMILNSNTIPFILYILVPMVVVGLLDDKYKIPKLFRFISQITLSILAIYLMNGMNLHPFIIFLIVFLTTYFINAYNFMDGIDLMIVLESIFILLSFLFLIDANSPWVFSIHIMIGVLLIFSLFNYNPAKLFLGNSGSYFLGMYISLLVIGLYFMSNINIITSFIICTIVVADTVYVIFRRFFYKLLSTYHDKKSIKDSIILGIKHITEAHCSHNYQQLTKKLKDHKRVVLLLMLYNALWCFPLAVISANYINYSALCLFVSYTPYIIWCYKNKAGLEIN